MSLPSAGWYCGIISPSLASIACSRTVEVAHMRTSWLLRVGVVAAVILMAAVPVFADEPDRDAPRPSADPANLAEIEAAQALLLAELPETFAGAWIDDDGETTVVAAVDGDPRVEARVVDMLTRAPKRFTSVSFSVLELHEVYEDLLAA
jgi:hypothetical protein